MENNKEHMMVAAIENGSVIDHIPTDKLFTVAQLLDLESCSSEVVIANNLKSRVIRDYKVAEKIEVTLPETLTDIVRCANPVCITNNEPMRTVFYRKDQQTLKCRYCGKEQKLKDIKLK